MVVLLPQCLPLGCGLRCARRAHLLCAASPRVRTLDRPCCKPRYCRARANPYPLGFYGPFVLQLRFNVPVLRPAIPERCLQCALLAPFGRIRFRVVSVLPGTRVRLDASYIPGVPHDIASI
jgi:hypothetical protein